MSHKLSVALALSTAPEETGRWLSELKKAMPDIQWHLAGDIPAHRAHEIKVAVVANPAKGSLKPFEHLEFIQSLWAGVEKLLTDETISEKVTIARMVDPALTRAMSETALWSVLSVHRKFFQYRAQQAQSLWQPLPQLSPENIDVFILGAGELGRAAAQTLSQNGYQVCTWSQSPQRRAAITGETALRITNYQGEESLYENLGRAHVVINLLPLTQKTENILNADFFGRMKNGAAIVNLARGKHLVEADLLDALNQNHLGYAILDVFQIEPLPIDHPFWGHPKITVLPHVAAITDPQSASQVVAAQIGRWIEGKPLCYVVDRHRGY